MHPMVTRAARWRTGESFARTVGLACGLLLAWLLFVVPKAKADEAKPAERPNIVIIYADDLGYGDLGVYGHPRFRTPRIDRMAREGARLTHFYTSCGYCAPSRASLMTGRYPFRNGMLINPHPVGDYGAGPNAGDTFGLPLTEITLGNLFQNAGYQTACIGKWHLGHKPHFYPTRRGFDSYFGILYSNDMNPVELFQNEEMIEFPVDQRNLTKRYTERAVKFIEQSKDKPFLLYLPHAMPHKPLAASEEFYKQSGAGLYGDALAELDWSVGQILDTLAEHKLQERTLVLFTSDNGPWFGGSSGGLRGMKATTFEGGIRVPMMAYLPGKIPAGHVCEEPAIIMDLFSTSLKFAGIDQPDDREIDGRDIWPLLTGDAKSPHEHLFSYQGRVRTVQEGKWKLHYQATSGDLNFPLNWVDPRRPNGKTILAQPEQYGPADYPGVKTGDTSKQHALFNLQTDPAEQIDVASEHPEVVARLVKLAEEASRIKPAAQPKLTFDQQPE